MQKLVYLGVILLFVCLVIGCSEDQQAGNQQAGNTVVAFTARDTRGQVHQSSEWIGKQPTVINFWGTWCPPCRREIPDLVRLYEEYRPKGIEIIGLAVNDKPATVEVFSQEAGMDWVMLMGDEAVVGAYGGISGVPTTIFLNKDGKEIGRVTGSRTYEEFKPAFDSILVGYEPGGAASVE